MKKISVIIAISIVASIGFGSTSAFADTPDENVWEQIEDSYYINSDDASSQFHNHFIDADNIDMEILEGGDLDESSITEFYESKVSLDSDENIEEFKKDVNSDGFFSALKFTNTYWAMAKRDRDRHQSSALIKKDKLSGLYVNDNGSNYKLHIDDDLKNSLSSSDLNLHNTIPYYFWIEGFARGIAFDDGENQLLQITGSRYDMVENGIYTIDEFISLIDEHSDELTETVPYTEGTIEGKRNVNTGGLNIWKWLLAISL